MFITCESDDPRYVEGMESDWLFYYKDTIMDDVVSADDTTGDLMVHIRGTHTVLNLKVNPEDCKLKQATQWFERRSKVAPKGTASTSDHTLESRDFTPEEIAQFGPKAPTHVVGSQSGVTA